MTSLKNRLTTKNFLRKCLLVKLDTLTISCYCKGGFDIPTRKEVETWKHKYMKSTNTLLRAKRRKGKEMIEAKVIGIKDINYTSKKTGALVSGRKLNVSYPSKECDGLEVATIYVSATAPEFKEFVSCKLGDSVQFLTSFQYGRYTNVFVRKG